MGLSRKMPIFKKYTRGSVPQFLHNKPAFHKGGGHLESKSAHGQFFTNQVKNYKTVVLCIEYYNPCNQ